MATEQNHRSMRPSQRCEGLQGTVGAPEVKPVRQAKKPMTMSEVMEPSLPRIIQQHGKAEERRLPRITQRLGSSWELWMLPLLTKRGGTQEGKLPPVPLTCGSSQEGKLPLLTRRGNPEERKLPPCTQFPASSGASWPKVQLPAAALEQSCFEPCPAEVVFKHYIPHEVYEMPLTVRNKGRVPQRLKVTLESSPYFKLVGPKDACQKVVPGMVSSYRILFSPEENKDYYHQLRCVTETAEFIVPIRGVGAQAVLDFPQQVDFSICPVKHSSQRTLLLRNVGEREAQYRISTQSPFSAAPSAGALGAGEVTQVTVGFLPLQRGNHRGSLSLRWDTGEAIHSRLRGTAVDVDIRLQRSSLTMEQTYLSLCTRRTLLIHNGSDVLAHFQWKASAHQEDGQQKQRLVGKLQGQEQLKPHPPEEQRPQSALRGRSSWLSRIFQQQKEKAQEDSLLCPEEIFSVEPLEGDVWPKSSAEVQVIFSPRAARTYEARLYCDISGREARLPLHVRGEGLGPRLCFKLDQLDIGQVFAGSTNRYKMVLHNKGAIDAFFSLVPPTTAVGSCFTFSPCQGLVQPDKFQVLEICFCATTLGPFTEEFVFRVEGCPEPVTSTIRGCVTAPTLHFDVPCLQFGDVSFGFPQSLCCRLTNASLVPVAFTLRVPGDGRAKPSVPSTVQALDNSRPSWRKRVRRRLGPREFTISPCSGTIRSLSFVDIQVTLCSNSLGTYELALVVDVDGVGQELLSLPLTARCVVPALHVPNPVVTFGHCYLQFPAQQTLTLVNDSDLPGCYGLLPQKQRKAAAVLYSSPVPCGIIQPHSSVEVPLTLEALVPGRQETRARVAVFGHPRDWLEVCLVSIGEGPVVSVQPSEVDFGSIQVLQDASRTLRLCNQSPIPASFQAEVAGKGSCWRIEPRQGVIPPEGEASVCVTVNLDDTRQFQAEVQLQVEHSRGYVIPVRALGIGTTIVTDRPLAPQLSLGTRFSLVPCCYSFKVSNHGRRTQRLYWSTAGGCQPGQRQHLPAPSSTRGKACHQSPTAACPVFRPRPMRMELTPGQTMELTLEGFSSTPQVVREQLLCHSIVGSEGRKNKIMQVALSCQFVAPALQMSSRALTFRVEKQAGDVLTPQEQALSLKNVCPLPLSMVLSLGQPFSICDVERQPLPDDEQPMKLEAGEELQLSISFNPAYEEGSRAWRTEQPLRITFLEHPHEEQVLVRVEVPTLQFQSRAVDFGCILNHTEAVHSLEMSNCSPLPAFYCWLLLPASQGSQLSPVGDAVEGAVAAPSHTGIREFVGLKETEPQRLRLEEVFDVLPLHGVLQPGQSQQVTFSFFGHPNIVASATALCKVQGGPSYEVKLSGEASLISYLLESRQLNVGMQLWEAVMEAEVMLQNSGKLPFTFMVPSPCTATARSPLPGLPLVVPSTGSVGAGQQQVLKIYYLPEVPGVFCKTLQIQVGLLETEEISLRGEGGFPRICLDLPRNISGNKKYEKLLRDLRRKLAEEMAEESERDGAAVLVEASATATPPDLDTTLDTGLQMQLEDLLIKEHILEQQEALACSAPEEAASEQQRCARRRLLKAELPEYILDFGCVVLAGVHKRTVKITNPGQLPVSFKVHRQVLRGTGFSVDLECVKQLRYSESRTLTVCLDPQSATLPLGEKEVLLPIKVAGGPTFRVLLRAKGVVPSLCLSRDRLEFSRVQCGQCREETTRLYNRVQVPCRWFVSRAGAAQKVNKHFPASRCQKLLKAEAPVFEVLPSAGVLAPGQWCNLQVRFAPVEEKPYSSKLKISVCQSSQHLQLLLSGSGLEPRLEFQPEVLDLGPVLPSSRGTEGTVVVRNPCEFPIEFYSLEFDQEYLAEEQLLRALEGYDCRRTLLLPSRTPGEQLPPELLEVWQAQERLQEQQAESKTEEPTAQDEAEAERQQSASSSKETAEELEVSPFHRALAHHLGIAVPGAGAAAPQCKGIVVIIHGAPLTGKTSAATAVAQHYGAACLSLEAVVSEAVVAGSSHAGRRAQALCAMAASRQQAKDGRLRAAAALRWRRSAKAILSSPLSQSSSGDKGRLSHGGSVAAGLGLVSCLLPEELLVAILTERLQLSDCSQGVVFDGLQTSFAGSTASALLCLLRAVGNRPHIYLVNLHQDFASWQARQRAAEKRAGREQEEAARREVAQLWELGEDEFDALPEEQKAQLESRIRQLQRERKQRSVSLLWAAAQHSIPRRCPCSGDLGGAQEGSRDEAQSVHVERVLGQLAGKPGDTQQQGLQHWKEADVKKLDKRKPGKDQEKRRQSLVGQGTNTSSSSTNVSSSKQKAAKKGTVKEHPSSDACKEEQRKQSKAALLDSCSGPDAEDPGQSGGQKDLALRFQAYEASRAAVAHVLSCWDRVRAELQPSSKQRTPRAKKKEHHERELLSRENSAESPEVSQLAGAGAGSGREVGVPCLDVEVQSSAEVASAILGSGKLPRAEQVLDELGLGPSGPPIPPPALYSVVRYPAKREVAAAGGLQCFVLLVPEEEAPDGVTDASAAKVPGQSSGRGRRRLHRPGSRRPSRRSPERVGTAPPPERSVRRSPYRWVVPAQGQVELQIHFSSSVQGQFEQRLHFELLGTQRCYQLHCRGTCLCPSISQEPRVVFPRCRKNKAAEDIIFKEYVLSTGVFHFGPLLCGKARDWSKALLQPGNCEKITICNVTPWEAEVHFSFEQDGCGNTFVLEPACMNLGPYEKQELRICAYPTAVGLVQDSLICCIKDNPEPVVFQLCCQGVQLKLGVSSKQLSFGRVLLKREHSRSLVLRNSCPLPVAWRLSGLESLGEGFSMCQCQGTVGPHAEFGLQLCFRPTKPLSVEKMIRLEVSDAEDVQGVVQIENIQVSAEAYEVALDITLPGGRGGCVDFGVVKVLGRAKQLLSLKNRGRYKIAYRFRLHPADPSTRDVASHFTVQPQRGLLPASQQAVSVQLLFWPQREITIEDKPILLCQVLEPGSRAGAEPVATIPVRLSAKAVFSQYSISPAALLDCGAMVSGTKRSCSFLMENRGLLPFEFIICKAEQGAAEAPKKRRLSHRKQSFNGRSAVAKQDRPLVPEETKPSTKARLSVDMFTVSPAFGCILPGHQQVVTVECAAGVPGPCQEQLLIDISDRDPRDNPLGIPYSLVAESCLPAFVTNDVESIFEEYQICSSSNLHQVLQTVEAEGVFVRDDNKFVFTNVLVGHQATARFKIANMNKVPCDVLLSIKPITRKLKSRSGHIFEVDPVQMSVPSCSHAFVTVTFTPQRAQSYCCTFEASLEMHTRPAAVGAASLSFGISGEGKLPAVRVLRPALRGPGGNPLLLFRRLPLGARQELPLVLHNSGTVPAQVLMDLTDEEGVFFLKAGPTTKCLYQGVGMKDSAGEERQLHTARLLLRRGEAAEFQVVFQPRLAQRLEGKIFVSVVDNPHEETTIRLVGEGHDEDFTLDNIQGLVADGEEHDLPESSLEDITEIAQWDHIQFGDCLLGTPYTITFTITNRSKTQALRFQWLSEAPFHFSPQVGHLHAGCAKDIGVTLQSEVEVTFRRHPVKCLVSRISFQLPPEEILDWDDCLGRVKWVDSTKAPGARWPVKKQVLEPEAEPAHSVLEGSSREVQLLLSAAVRCPELQLATEGPENSSSQEVSSGQAQGSARLVAGSAQLGQVPGCSLPPGQLSSQGRGTGTASGSSVPPAQPGQTSYSNARGGSAEGNTSSKQASVSVSLSAAVLLVTSRNAGADVSQVPGSSSSSIALPQVAGSQQAAAQ
ncbi:hydrocephalus-inducing protein homolog [Pogoniulus pusillus]|uniref:hydrocephalus-inducing protein homolog n=1 Tax=Pogoniulus pusillus TaxID=488313 RepID=UPI0030B9543E